MRKKGFGWTPVFAPEVRFLFLHFRIWENEGEEGVFASPRAGENSWEKNHGFFLRAYTYAYSTLLVQMRIEWGFKMQRGGEGETPPRSLHTHLNEENSWLRICEVWRVFLLGFGRYFLNTRAALSLVFLAVY